MERLSVEVGGTAYETVKDLIVFVSVYHDECSEDPCENDDGMGHVKSFNRSFRNFDPNALDKHEAVPLSYFEHGLCLWGVAGTMNQMPDFCWDGVSLAGAWVPGPHVRQAADMLELEPDSPERLAWMRKQAAFACEVYTAYCNGQVFGYDVTAYVAEHNDGFLLSDKDDYADALPVFEDSCWGFYGDDVLRGIKEALDYAEIELEVS